jgi:formate/nitrite transporter FocA (FNT family)
VNGREARAVSDLENGDIEDVREPPSEGSVLQDSFAFPEIFRRVLASAREELDRPTQLLFWSGLAAGLSLGLTFFARATMTGVAGAVEPGFVGNLLYPVGFVIIVLGKYQLFTENTLTPVALVLTKLARTRNLLRLWGTVLVANLVGAAAISALFALTDVKDDAAAEAALAMGKHALEADYAALFWRAVLAGWIVATMVWLVHAVSDSLSRIVVVWMLMYFIGVSDLFHVVTGTVEVLFVVFEGQASFWGIWHRFVIPVLVGNVLGGIGFVAILNTAQFGREEDGDLIERLRQGEELHDG